jgi:hypothetical protein
MTKMVVGNAIQGTPGFKVEAKLVACLAIPSIIRLSTLLTQNIFLFY